MERKLLQNRLNVTIDKKFAEIKTNMVVLHMHQHYVAPGEKKEMQESQRINMIELYEEGKYDDVTISGFI